MDQVSAAAPADPPRAVLLVAWLPGLLLLAARAVQGKASSFDLDPVLTAGRLWVEGGDPFLQDRFLYPPSSALLFAPAAWVPAPAWIVLCQVSAAVGVVALVLVGQRLFLPTAPLAAPLGLVGVCVWTPLSGGFLVNNVAFLQLAPFAAFLWLAVHRRWVPAGVVLGVALAIKPQLAPVVLLLVLARQWRALAICLAIPGVLSVLALARLAQPETYFTKTVPYLLDSQDGYAAGAVTTWNSVLSSLGVPGATAATIGLLVVAATVVCAVLVWQIAADDAARVVLTSTVLLTGTFVGGTVSFDHYALFVIPFGFLAASYTVALLPFALLVDLGDWPGDGWTAGPALRETVAITLIGVSAIWVAMRARRVPAGPPISPPRQPTSWDSPEVIRR